MTRKTIAPWMIRSSALAMGCALVMLGATTPALSQSLLGTPTVVAGSVDSITTGSNSTSVVLSGSGSRSAVINWAPDNSGSGTIVFQQAGTTATFSSFDGGDFSVLNRILPTDTTRPVQLNGAIQSFVGLSPSVTGGTVYFYSPGGIILGPTAQVDVGRLGLSTAPVIYQADGSFVNTGTAAYDSTQAMATVNYGPATQGTRVEIQSGAHINAAGFGSYVALFAPVIKQDGTIFAAGSTALVAGAAGTLSWTAGLFNISVNVGTDGDGSGTAIEHGGSTGGTQGVSAQGDIHRVYMVAVPRNTAITTLISAGSQLGFDVAGVADIQGNAVILSAGLGASGDALVVSPSAGTGQADVLVQGGSFTSSTRIYARGRADIMSSSGLAASFASNLSVIGQQEASVKAVNAGSSITVAGVTNIFSAVVDPAVLGGANAGAASLQADNGGAITLNGDLNVQAQTFVLGTTNNTGGAALISASNGGSVTINANALIGSDGFGVPATTSGIGGTTTIAATGGNASIIIDGTLGASAHGKGGDNDAAFAGSNGTGGTLVVNAGTTTGSNNLIRVTGGVVLDAAGQGGSTTGGVAGDGTGGTILVSVGAGGRLDLQSFVTLDASGTGGGDLGSFLNAANGKSQGGSATLRTVASDAVATIGDTLFLNVRGLPNSIYNSTVANSGTGGSALLSASQGSLTVAGLTQLYADGQGGPGSSGPNFGRGGSAIVNADVSGTLTLGQVALSATGTGSTDFGLGVVGDGFGGTVRLFNAGSGSIHVTGTMTGDTRGISVPGQTQGAAVTGTGTGGTVDITQGGSGAIQIDGAMNLNAVGVGTDAYTQNGSAPITGGAGIGGTASINLTGTGGLSFGNTATIDVTGDGGQGVAGSTVDTSGGLGRGGAATIQVTGSGTLSFALGTQASALGQGGDVFADNGAGGAGMGGSATITVTGSGSIVTGNGSFAGLVALAEGRGGAAGGTSAAGAATGGNALLSVTGSGSMSNVFAAAIADAVGGAGSFGDGGAATGGTAGFLVSNGGTFNAGLAGSGQSNSVLTDAQGGSSEGGGNGGAAYGGTASIQGNTGGTLNLNLTTLMSVGATGGNGQVGGVGDARGLSGTDNLIVRAGGGTINAITPLLADGTGTGGTSFVGAGIGGAGFGARAFIGADSPTGPSQLSHIVLQSLTVLADGTGGSGATQFSSDTTTPATGGRGGDGTGGSIRIEATATGPVVNPFASVGAANVALSAQGVGGAGGSGEPSAGSSGIGADGGVGGTGVGGTLHIAAAGNNGLSFGAISATLSAQGGVGGAGGGGLGGTGNGGAGGAALALGSTAFPRAIDIADPVSLGFVSLTRVATGGDGGAGTVTGAGGDATVDGFRIRLAAPNGAPFTIGDLSAAAIATGGSGSTNGRSYYGAGPVLNSTGLGTATLNSLSLTLSAASPSLTAPVVAGSVLVGGGATISNGPVLVQTPGGLAVAVTNGGLLQASSLTLNAADFTANFSGQSPSFVPGTLSANAISLTSGANILLGANLVSAGAINLNAPGLISAYDMTSGAGDLRLTSTGDVTARSLTATTGAVLVQSGGKATLGALSGTSLGSFDTRSYSVAVHAAGDIGVGALTSTKGILLYSDAGAIRQQPGAAVNADSYLALLAHGDVVLGDVNATGTFFFADSAMGSFVGPFSSSYDPTPLFSVATLTPLAGQVSVGTVNAGSIRFANSGLFTFSDMATGNSVFGASGSIVGGNIDSAFIDLSTTGALIVGDLFGAADITLVSGGNLTTGSITAPGSAVLVNSGGRADLIGSVAGGSVAVRAVSDIRFGAVSSATGVVLISDSGLVQPVPTSVFDAGGPVTAGGDILLLGRSGLSAGDVSTDGTLFIGDSSMASLGGAFGPTFDPTAILNAATVTRLAGDVSLGAVAAGGIRFGNTGRFAFTSLTSGQNIAGQSGSFAGGDVQAGGFLRLDADGNMALGRLTAGADILLTTQGAMSVAAATTPQSLNFGAGGLLTINGTVSAPTIQLQSGDIALGSNARIDAGLTGAVTIASSNAGGMALGDRATGGYTLDAGEFARIHSGSVLFASLDGSGATDLTIGDVAITGPLAGSTIDALSGSVTFFTGDAAHLVSSGAIRVTGTVTATGFRDTNALVFSTGRFEMDADTGLVEIRGAGGALAGQLVFDTPDVRVATATVLGKLAQDPRYAGRGVDLNASTAIARPGGILRAGTIDLSAAQAALIQNTGTAMLPAGFLANSLVLPGRAISPGSLDLIINGQLLTGTKTVTGADVLPLLVDDAHRPDYTAASSVNGCLVSTSTCAPVAQDDGILSQSNLIAIAATSTNNPPMAQDDPETPEEQRARDAAAEEAKHAPIPPPTPLISTQPLNPVVDVDEPVAGSGNPALIGGGAFDMSIGRGKQ